MDPQTIELLKQSVTKTASLSTAVQNYIGRTNQVLEAESAQKSASYASAQKRAEKLAYDMSQTLLPSGVPMLTGHEEMKKAAAMLSNHDSALSVVELLLDTVKQDAAKRASLEPGRASGSASTASVSAWEGLRKSSLGY